MKLGKIKDLLFLITENWTFSKSDKNWSSYDLCDYSSRTKWGFLGPSISVSVHFLEKWRHFISPKTLLCFRVSWS